MTLKAIHVWTICALLTVNVVQPSDAAEQLPDIVPLSAFYDTGKMYPSLTPRRYIKIGYGALLAGEQGQPKTYLIENLTQPSTWIVRKVTTTDTAESKSSVIPERVDVSTAEGVAYLFFRPGTFKKSDKLEVGLVAKKRTPAGDYREVEVIHGEVEVVEIARALIDVGKEPEPPLYTLKLNPATVQDQELLNGLKEDVLHLKLDYENPSLFSRGSARGARVYLKTENLFSTNSLDKTAAVDLKIGAERSLTSRWYIPISLESEVLGNQRLSNASYVLSAGGKTLLPWRWSRRLLFNRTVAAPIPPEIEFRTQYERRFRIDDRAPLSHANKNLFRLFAQIAWNPVYLFAGKTPTAKDISLELLAKGWLFPNEKATGGAKVRRREGRLELSLLIPMSGLPDSLIIGTPEEGTVTRIRIKYTDGANEANGFARSAEWIVAVEALK